MVAEYWGGTEVMLTSTRRIEKGHPRRSDLGPTLLGVEGPPAPNGGGWRVPSLQPSSSQTYYVVQWEDLKALW
jgi:hypothetical protein